MAEEVCNDEDHNFGYVSRMDNLQAAILNFRLKNLNHVINIRRNNFKLYKKYLDKKVIYFPEEKKNEFNRFDLTISFLFIFFI